MERQDKTPQLFILGNANAYKHTNLAAWHEAHRGLSDDALIVINVD